MNGDIESVTKEATNAINRVKEIEIITKGKQDIQAGLDEQRRVLKEIEAKKEEVKSIEGVIDRKTNELKKILFDSQIKGITAGEMPQIKREETPKEYADRIMGVKK